MHLDGISFVGFLNRLPDIWHVLAKWDVHHWPSTGKEVTAAQSDTDIWGSYGLILAEYGRIFSSTLLSVIAAQ